MYSTLRKRDGILSFTILGWLKHSLLSVLQRRRLARLDMKLDAIVTYPFASAGKGRKAPVGRRQILRHHRMTAHVPTELPISL